MSKYIINNCVIPTIETTRTKYALIILIRNRYFASGIFYQNKCIMHYASQRYAIRKGQGKLQSSCDLNNNGKAKSMGAQSRRQGEIKLREDMQYALQRYYNNDLLACVAICLSS